MQLESARGVAQDPPAFPVIPKVYDCPDCEWLGTELEVDFIANGSCLLKYRCPECTEAFTVIGQT